MAAPRSFFDNANHAVSLAGRIGFGGEGDVFDIVADPKTVAKVYKKAITREHQEKLRAMVSLARGELLQIAAWPTRTLHEVRDGPIIGLLMPKVDRGKDAHILYSPAHRKMIFPQADWEFLIHAAMNCAEAFEIIHQAGVVIGDVNQSNVFITDKATARLIDCDSFQIVFGGTTFYCDVGVPLYTPPELQEKPFRGVTRTPNHDRFGLAILLFHLLFMGRHPFSGRYVGSGEMPLEKAIAQFRYAYGVNAGRFQMQPPINTVPVTVASTAILQLFERAFSSTSAQPNARPTGAEWKAALKSLKSSLQRCRADTGHVFPKGLALCPWCQLLARGAPNFFISVAFTKGFANQTVTVDVRSVWTQIEQITLPSKQLTLPPRVHLRPAPLPSSATRPIPPRIRIKPAQTQTLIKVTAIGFGLLAFPLFFAKIALGVAVVLTALTCGIWWLLLETQRKKEQKFANRERNAIIADIEAEIDRRHTRLRNAEEDFREKENEWHRIYDRHENAFRHKLTELRAHKQKFEDLQHQYVRDQQTLQANAKANQRSQYLQQTFISDHDISGIGPTRLAALASFGIETAFDVVEQSVLDVPGFGPGLTKKLIDWRATIEAAFVFNAAVGVPSQDKLALEMKYQSLRQRIILALQSGITELTTTSNSCAKELNGCLTKVHSVVRAVEQAKADVTILPEI
jgi:DNA-binding helix-hairpin-helix protein with protein kinase domain